MGALSGGGAIATGTGAFTSVSANRDVSVAVASDANAYLSIDDTGNANAEYITESNGELAIDLTGDNETDDGGAGVNADAVTVLQGLFEVQNQGTQEVEVQVTPLSFVEPSGGGDTTLIVLAVPRTSFPKVTVSSGDAETYDMVVTATDDATTSTDGSQTITVTGEAP